MDHVLFYGVVTLSLMFGAAMYHANMAEAEPGLPDYAVTSPRLAFSKPWWQRLLEPESLMATAAAALCVLILNLG